MQGLRKFEQKIICWKSFLLLSTGAGGGGGWGVEGGWVRMSYVENFLKINKWEDVY